MRVVLQVSKLTPGFRHGPVLHRSSRQYTCLLQPRQLLACATLLIQKWWRGVDLNHRSLTTTDLQSVPFGRSGTPPRYTKTLSRSCRNRKKERDLHRPPESDDSGNMEFILFRHSKIWSWRWESNPQPADYKSAALPVELRQQQVWELISKHSSWQEEFCSFGRSPQTAKDLYPRAAAL